MNTARDISLTIREARHVVSAIPEVLIARPLPASIGEHAASVKTQFPLLENGLRELGSRDGDPVLELITQGCSFRHPRGSQAAIGWFARVVNEGA